MVFHKSADGNDYLYKTYSTNIKWKKKKEKSKYLFQKIFKTVKMWLLIIDCDTVNWLLMQRLNIRLNCTNSRVIRFLIKICKFTFSMFVHSFYIFICTLLFAIIEFGKIRKTKASSNPIYTCPIKWIGKMFFENSLSGHFYARRNCYADWINWVQSTG